jgi:voltage-gated potassium channel
MGLFLDFGWRFLLALVFVSPLLISFLLLITVLGLVIGKREGWARFDAIYFAFITATTVGFGDYSPKGKLARILTIVIALLGLIFTGIVIALAIHAAGYAFKHLPDFTEAVQTISK